MSEKTNAVRLIWIVWCLLWVLIWLFLVLQSVSAAGNCAYLNHIDSGLNMPSSCSTGTDYAGALICLVLAAGSGVALLAPVGKTRKNVPPRAPGA